METRKWYINMLNGKVEQHSSLFSFELGTYTKTRTHMKRVKSVFVAIPVNEKVEKLTNQPIIVSYKEDHQNYSIILTEEADLKNWIMKCCDTDVLTLEPDKIIRQPAYVRTEDGYREEVITIKIKNHRKIDYLRFIDIRRFQFKKHFEVWKTPNADCRQNRSEIRRKLGLFYDKDFKLWLIILMKNSLVISVFRNDPFLELPIGEIPWHIHWRKESATSIVRIDNGEVTRITEPQPEEKETNPTEYPKIPFFGIPLKIKETLSNIRQHRQ